MPEQKVIQKALQDKKQGKSPSTQAGEFVREEMHHIRQGKHGARSAKQAIAIGLSEARRAGVELPPRGTASSKTRRNAPRATGVGQGGSRSRPSSKRSAARLAVLRREGRAAASPVALSRQARASARQRGPANRSAAARKAAVTRARERSTRR